MFHYFRSLILFMCLCWRVASFAADPPAPGTLDITEFHWKQGEKPVRMIKKDEGFCYLANIHGHFEGAGEMVRVYLDEDGYWYLGGASNQAGVGGTAFAVKFPGGVKTVMHQAPPAARLADLVALTGSKDATVQEAARTQIKDFPDDPKKKIEIAQSWLAMAKKDTTPLKNVMLRHAGGLLASSIAGLDDAELAGAIKQQLRDLSLDFARDHLNDLSQWTIAKGEWDSTTQSHIRGRGNSELLFNHPLPGDGTFSFHFKVMEGMRPRIRFDGTGLYIGNEGYDRVLEAHGSQQQNGVRSPYALDQDLAVTLKIVDQNFELRINNEIMSKGRTKTAADAMYLRLSAGDDWSFGTCEFWDLKFALAEKQ